MKLCYLEGNKLVIFFLPTACKNHLILYSCRHALCILPSFLMAVGPRLSLSLVWSIIFHSRERRLKKWGKCSVGNGLLLNALFPGNTAGKVWSCHSTDHILMQERGYLQKDSWFSVLPSHLISFFFHLTVLFYFCVLTSSLYQPEVFLLHFWLYGILKSPEKGSAGAGISGALISICVGLFCAVGSCWIQPDPWFTQA